MKSKRALILMRKYRQRQSGAAMIEFVIIFPILLLITFGIITLGLITAEYQLYDFATARAGRAMVTGVNPSNDTCLGDAADCCESDTLVQKFATSLSTFKLNLPDNTKANEEFSICLGSYLEIPYLRVSMKKKLNCYICQMGLGFNRLADFDEKYFFILEQNSPLWQCLSMPPDPNLIPDC